MPAAGYEPTIPTIERLQTHALDRAVTEIGSLFTPLYLTFSQFPYLQFSITARPVLIIILLSFYYNTLLCISAALPLA
jgi:hypothetical protein